MLAVGLVSAMSIIEPRRRGKTTFLQDDLAPAARDAGYLTIYVNLAVTAPHPEATIASAIEAALHEQAGVMSRLRRIGAARVKKLAGRASLTTGEVGAEVELESPYGRFEGPLASLFLHVARTKKPVLFLLDEVHALADVRHDALAWGFRSLLDTHRATIKVVATSSSAAAYELLVSGEKKAFKGWFTRIALTPLAGGFVSHLGAVVKKHYPGHPIAPRQVGAAFGALGSSPKFIRDYLNARILDPGLSHEAALHATASDAAKDSAYADEFARLVPLQRAVVFALLGEGRQLFGEEALRSFAAAIEADVDKSAVQRAASSLAAKGWIIRQARGDYRIADGLFEQRLREQVKTGLLQGPPDDDEGRSRIRQAPGRGVSHRTRPTAKKPGARRASKQRR